VLLPARLPMVLLNGASGIAVGLATEIPSHNLGEVAQAAVAMIRNPKISHAELMALVPGPDFPAAARSSRRRADRRHVRQRPRLLKVRARWKIEELARGQWQAVVTELPPGTSAQKVLEEIEELTNPKIKLGKKALTPEQLALKSLILNARRRARRIGPRRAGAPGVRAEIEEPGPDRIHADAAGAHLAGIVGLDQPGDDRRRWPSAPEGPARHPAEWITFRFATVTRRTQFKLGKVDDRIHILEGRQTILLNIDEVIHIIRKRTNPKRR
jgi:topoisomerase-4 subunit A